MVSELRRGAETWRHKVGDLFGISEKAWIVYNLDLIIAPTNQGGLTDAEEITLAFNQE